MLGPAWDGRRYSRSISPRAVSHCKGLIFYLAGKMLRIVKRIALQLKKPEAPKGKHWNRQTLRSLLDSSAGCRWSGAPQEQLYGKTRWRSTLMIVMTILYGLATGLFIADSESALDWWRGRR